AVPSQEPNSLPWLNLARNAIQQRRPAIANPQILDADEGHEASAEKAGAEGESWARAELPTHLSLCPTKPFFGRPLKLRQHFARTAVDRGHGPELLGAELFSQEADFPRAEQHVHAVAVLAPHVDAGVKARPTFLQVVGL